MSAKWAEDYRLVDEGLVVDGELFPWHVLIDGPRVESLSEHHHVLWVPIMVRKPAPGTWDERGERLEAGE